MEQEAALPKVSLGEIVLFGLILFIVDVFCTLLDFTGIGAAVTPFIQAGFTAMMTAWFYWSKKDKAVTKLGRQIIKYASNLLPWVPTLFVVFVVEAYMHNHPKQAGVPIVEKMKNISAGKTS